MIQIPYLLDCLNESDVRFRRIHRFVSGPGELLCQTTQARRWWLTEAAKQDYFQSLIRDAILAKFKWLHLYQKSG